MREHAANPVLEVLPFLPPRLRGVLAELHRWQPGEWYEIRLRVGQPLSVVDTEGERFPKVGGGWGPPREGILVTSEDLSRALQLMGEGSIYSLEEELRQGYLTLPGGHRVGLAGEMNLRAGRPEGLRRVTFLNLRLSREIPGAARELLPVVGRRGRAPYNTLLFSSPGAGKTTVLRDLIRSFSHGVPELGLPPVRIGVVDERSELAGCHLGVPQRDLGPRTDVLDHCPKAYGMVMLLRAMGPQVLVGDEIGRPEDVEAVLEALHAGVSVLVTAHGASLAELQARPTHRQLLQSGAIERYVRLERRPKPGTVTGVWDGRFRPLGLPGQAAATGEVAGC